MSTRTTKMNLVTNTESDPFLIEDFATNWSALDSSPGIYVCTSQTRPTWGVNQAGRTIVETDTFRQLIWNGGNWQEPLVAPGVWMFETAPQVALGNSTSTSWTLGTITTKRPLQLTTFTTAVATRSPDSTQSAVLNCTGRIDGTGSNISGAATGILQWSSMAHYANAWSDSKSATMFGYRRVNPGSHTIGVAGSVSTSTSGGDPKIVLRALSVVVLATAPSGGMSLV